jgi:hypothetical protein
MTGGGGGGVVDLFSIARVPELRAGLGELGMGGGGFDGVADARGEGKKGGGFVWVRYRGEGGAYYRRFLHLWDLD